MEPKQEITDLEELIDLLDNSSKEEYKSLGKRIAIPLKQFEDYAFFDDEAYTRNCIKRTDDYELILLCWKEGQKTPIHCHNEQECWVHVLKGEFLEKRFEGEEGDLTLDHKMSLGQERVSYMNDDMGYHSLENTADGKAMSLHLYMDPIDRCRVYDEEESRFELKELEYYSYAGVLEEA